MYVCVKQAYQNYATNMKVSIFIPYDIYLICIKFGTFTLTCMIVPKGWCCPFSVLCLSDASPIIADNCNALCPIPPSAVRSANWKSRKSGIHGKIGISRKSGIHGKNDFKTLMSFHKILHLRPNF